MTVLLATHNLNRLVEVADRVLWLEDGRVKFIGPPEEVVTSYRNFMRSSDDEKND